MARVELASVGKNYGPVVAVADLSLRVESGEFTTVLGPSGSGKTTMLSVLAGIVPPTSGRIVLDGRDITALPAAKRNIGVVFQSYALFPHLNVVDNIAFPLTLRRVARAEIKKRVEAALQMVRLSGYGKRRPNELSGGQQQRVALARALVFNPDILLLDEPLAALDRRLRDDVRQEIRHLQRSLGITTIMVTHDQDEALSLSDRIVVLNHGRVEQVDEPMRMYRQPRTRFVAEFLGTANLLHGQISRAGGSTLLRLDTGGTIPVTTTVEAATRVCAMIRPEAVDILAASAQGDAPTDALTGVVEETVFLGETVRYVVRLRGGQQMIAHARSRGRPLSQGSAATLSWSCDDVWIIPIEGRAC